MSFCKSRWDACLANLEGLLASPVWGGKTGEEDCNRTILTPIDGISKFTKLFSARKAQKIISYLLRTGLLLLAVLLVVSCTTYHYPAKPATGVYHRVKKGETFYGIARAYRIDPQYLAKVNNIKNIEIIMAGEVLFIPYAKKAMESNIALGRKGTGDEAGGNEQGPSRGKKVLSQKERPGAKRPGSTGTLDSPEAGIVKAADGEEVTASAKKGSEITITSEDIPPEGIEKVKPADTFAKPGPEEAPIEPERETGETSALDKEKTEKISLEPLAKIEEEKAPQVEIAPVSRTFVWPVKGKVVSRFGRQRNGMFFNGIDIAGQENTPVVAAAGGMVIFSAVLKDYGETIIIKHDRDYATVYSYLGKRLVKRDDRIEQNDMIGTLAVSGSGGEAVVHFEIRHKNKARDPLSFLR